MNSKFKIQNSRGHIVMIMILVVLSCTSRDTVNQYTTISSDLKYAEGFTLRKEGNINYVTVNYPYPGATEGDQYMLVPSGEEVPAHDENIQVIRTPVKTI